MKWIRRLAVILLLAIVVLWILGGRMSLPDNSERSVSRAIPYSEGEQTRIGRGFAEQLAAHPGKNGVWLLRNGRDAFVARVILAQMAERSIDLQYYMFHHDTVGNLLIFNMIKAADRGVRVRMLIDDVYGNEGEDDWVAVDAHPNIEVRLFNPWVRGGSRALQYLTRMSDVNYRMHSKTYTVDNQATILGGRNIGDEYFEATSGLSFTDRDVLVVGPTAEDVEGEFDEYWNSEYAFPVATIIRQGTEADLAAVRTERQEFYDRNSTSDYLEALHSSPLVDALRTFSVDLDWSETRIIHDSSRKKAHDTGYRDELLISKLAPYITGARSEVTIVSPYFVPGDKATEALCKLSRDGVRVRILTNSLVSNDVAAVHAGYSKYRKPLLRCGVELWELNERLRERDQGLFTWLPGLSKSSLHAKVMGFDREILFVGSFNFDKRSLYINNEIGVLIENAELGGSSAEYFDGVIEQVAFRVTLETDDKGKEKLRWDGFDKGQPVTFYSEPYASTKLKALATVMGWLPIEAQL